MPKKAYTNKQYWSSNFDKISFFKFPETIPQEKYLKKYLTRDSNKSCIEIGAYPGYFLGYLTKKYGYQSTALDFLDESDFIIKNMEFNGIHDCKLINKDFLNWKPEEKYDLVCSFGFIEHFDNYEDVISKHVSLLKPGGLLVLSIPSLEYYQFFVRKILYTRIKFHETLISHNREIMKLKQLKRSLNKHSNLRIFYADYIREMTFWVSRDSLSLRPGRLWLFDIHKVFEKFFKKIKISSKFFSPEIFVVAKKDDSF